MSKSKYGGVSVPLEEMVSLAREKMEAEEGDRNYLGASIIGKECERELWYAFRHARKSAFPGRIHRRFDMGHWGEDRLIQDLRIAGFDVQCVNPLAKGAKDQFRASLLGGLVSGGVDGFVSHESLGEHVHLLEAKVMVSSKYERDEETGEPIANYDSGKRSREFLKAAVKKPMPDVGKAVDLLTKDKKKALGRWWKVKAQGVKRAQPTHYAQIQLYMGMSHAKDHWKPDIHVWSTWGLDAPLKRGLYVAVNSDTSQIYAEVVEYDAEYARELYTKALRIITSTTPPERIAATAKYPPCSFCDMKEVCHYGEPMKKDCRTCQHMELKLPGKAGNRGKTPLFLCTKNKRSCGKFEPCDNYQPINQEESF